MITISLRSVAEAFVGFAWWASFSVLALMVVLSVIAVVCGHYDDKGYWPKKALKITVLGKNRQWFRVTLLITNIACCVWLPRLFALDTGGPAGQLSAERHRRYLGYPPAGRFQLAVGQKH